jgi:NADPH:quinone reductase
MRQQVPATMHAVAISKPGGPEVLQAITCATPTPQPGEVLIQVRAAGVNGHDLGQRRRGSHPIAAGETELPGLEVSGTVIATAQDVTTIQVGDSVCALMRGGGYAEFATADQGCCLRLPKGFDWVQAAALPEACFTIWSNVFIDAALKPGETMLMNGGAGGIGATAIQLATALGSTVFATTRGPQKVAKCLSLGAKRVLDTTQEDYVSVLAQETHGKGIDVIVEVVAGDYLMRDLEALGEGGRLVIIGAAKGTRAEIDTSLMSRKRLRMMSSILRPRTIAYKTQLRDALLRTVWPLYDVRRIMPVIDSTFPLPRAAAAHERMESGQHFGKVILVADETIAGGG